jgi:hypothetical protein
MLILRCDKKSVLVGFGCYTVNVFLFRSGRSARALIVIRQPLTSKVTLRQPKAMNVVDVQDGSTFRMYPSDAPKLRQRITLAEGNSEFEGLTVEIDPVIGNANTFTWSPPIRRTQQQEKERTTEREIFSGPLDARLTPYRKSDFALARCPQTRPNRLPKNVLRRSRA